MENTTQPTSDCGCNGDCNPPKSKSRWIKYLSILILLAAISIVIVKVTEDKKAPASKCCATPGKSCCSDSSKVKSCDTTQKSSCCSKK